MNTRENRMGKLMNSESGRVILLSEEQQKVILMSTDNTHFFIKGNKRTNQISKWMSRFPYHLKFH